MSSPTLQPELADGIHPDEFNQLRDVTCHDPHRLLGAHAATVNGKSGLAIRAWKPDAAKVEFQEIGNKKPQPMTRLTDDGVFGIWLEGRETPIRYEFHTEFKDGATHTGRDPYNFLPTLGDLDLYLLGQGNHYEAYNKMGAQVTEMDGVAGVAFAVWAPSAKRVSIIGDFNFWNGQTTPMRSMGPSGVWEVFVPGLESGARYKYEIQAQDGRVFEKADPYAFAFDLRPSTHSRVHDRTTYTWKDGPYMDILPQRTYLEEPMNVYEVHLGSWMRIPEEEDRWLNYREAAHAIVDHAKKYSFTHVELMPVAEHPFDGSWGYQVTGYYAPTSRFGSPDDFKYFVDYLHRHGLGVIVDWVPAHFPKDDFALRQFDGSALFEHADPRQGEHMDWGTLIFNYGRAEVKNFLLSNALFWLEEYHIDGLRVDAVASMLYLDYSREEGQWVPNKYGGRENLEAIDFLRQLNDVVHAEYPGRFTVAEESTSFTGVSRPTYMGGLGFTFKWNMGWMNDTLEFFAHEPIHRQYHQNELTFSMVYQYTENFILPFSHDEVVHGKGSMLDKMPGDDWQKFANLRLLYTFMFAHPGKKLLFQGAEFGQWAEWDHAASLDWHQAQYDNHKGIESCLSDLGKFYREHDALWKWDNEEIGFRWIDFSDHGSSVLSFVRIGPSGHLVCAFNFTPVTREGYRIGFPQGGFYEEVFNSDSGHYGGSNAGNNGGVDTQLWSMHNCAHSAEITIPPLGAVFFRHVG
jgi:1,4-alpha-glucan branching enzyme